MSKGIDKMATECENCREAMARIDIAEALAKFCHNYDSGNFDRLHQTFAAQARIDLGTSFKGTLEQFERWARTKRESGNRYSHHITNLVVESGDPDETAKSTSAVAALAVSGSPDECARLVHGIYFDKWQRQVEGWRIIEREFTPEISVIVSD